MVLRTRKSEYQQCFASPDEDYFKNIYQEQMAYRLNRREKEHCHYVMKWDSENSEESSDSSGEKTPDHVKKTGDAEKVLQRLENTTLSKEKEASIGTASPLGTAISEVSVSIQTQTENKSSSERPSKCRSASERSKEKPPFLSYGWADEQVLSGRKKTRNIRAPKKTVYPAALQRSVYLKQEKQKQKLKSERRCTSATSLPLYQKPTDTSGWQSEYQRCYSSQSSRPSSASAQKKRDTKSRRICRPKSAR